MVGLSEHIVDLLERRYEHVTEGVFWHYIMADLISEEEASAAMFGLPSVPSSRDVYFRAKDALERNGVSGERASILIGQ